MSEVLEQRKACTLLAGNVVDHLVADFSQYDKIYRSWSQRRVGKDARFWAVIEGSQSTEFFKNIATTPTLFPEIEHEELETAFRGFATRVGKRYIHRLFDGTYRSSRPYSIQAFPCGEGKDMSAMNYLREIWAPAYAAEIVTAHSLGLTSESKQINQTSLVAMEAIS